MKRLWQLISEYDEANIIRKIKFQLSFYPKLDLEGMK